MNTEFLDASYKVSGRGWLSSAPDMARFEAAILNNRLLKSATRDIMWTQSIPSDGLGRMAYGLGWQFGVTEGVKSVGHGGSQHHDPDYAGRESRQILRIVLGLPEHEHREIAVDGKLFDSYLCLFAQIRGQKITFLRAVTLTSSLRPAATGPRRN